MAEQTTFDPAATNPVYDSLLSEWQLNRDFAEMHLKDIRDGTYLDKFGGGDEPANQYELRRQMSFAIDPSQDLICLRVDNIFRTPPARNYEQSPFRDFIESFLKDVDGGGTTMDEFMRMALADYYTNGTDIVIDKEGSDVAPENAAQEEQLGIRPFLHRFGPIERINWSVDHSGAYWWARYDLGEVPTQDEHADNTGTRRYLTVTRDLWRLYETTVSDSQKTSTTVEEGTHILGECPVVTFYFKESGKPDLPKVPLSLLTRISPIARYILNLMSELQIDIYRSVAFLVATGVQADQIPTEITPMGCWALPDGAALSEVAGPVEHITAKQDLILLLIQQILRIGKMGGHSGDMQARATSGTQVAVERTDLDNEMRMTAHQAEAVEVEVMRMVVSRSIGRAVTKDELQYSVAYNEKFVLTGVADIIADVLALVQTDTHVEVPEILKNQLRNLVNAIATEDEDAYSVAMEEINAMDVAMITHEGEGAAEEVAEVEGFK